MSHSFAPVRGHLAKRRRKLRLTQDQLAELANVEPAFIKYLETRVTCALIPGDGKSPRWWAAFGRVCKELDEEPVGLLRRFGLIGGEA